ncbi:MAG: hypothetical protein ACTTIM_02765 [Campylobacter sp.]
MEKVVLNFIEIDLKTDTVAKYTDVYSGDRSYFCARICTRDCYNDLQMNKLEACEKFFEVETGVIQY